MLANKRYKIGSLYYECGMVSDLNGRYVPWTVTWVYMGFVHTPGCSSVACDVPEHFYYFKRFEGTMAHSPPEKWKTTGVYVPSLRQAMRTKLTWKQMLSYGLARMLKECNDQSNDSATS
jgi:hypothetical protein